MVIAPFSLLCHFWPSVADVQLFTERLHKYAAFLFGWSTPSRSVDRAGIMLSERSAQRPHRKVRSLGQLRCGLAVLPPLSRVRIAQTHSRLRGQFRRFFMKALHRASRAAKVFWPLAPPSVRTTCTTHCVARGPHAARSFRVAAGPFAGIS